MELVSRGDREMTYKNFYKWCLERTQDGRWGFVESALCMSIISEVNQVPFGKRKRIWELHRASAERIVELNNKKYEEITGE